MLESFGSWIRLPDQTFVRRDQVAAVHPAGRDVEVEFNSVEARRFTFKSEEEAQAFVVWILRKTDDPPEVLMKGE